MADPSQFGWCAITDRVYKKLTGSGGFFVQDNDGEVYLSIWPDAGQVIGINLRLTIAEAIDLGNALIRHGNRGTQ